MGEGFVVAASNEIDIYYYMDEAGIIPPDQVRISQTFCAGSEYWTSTVFK